MKFTKIRDVKTPTRGTPGSAGIDFYIPNNFEMTNLEPNERINIPSGIKVKVPSDFMLCAFNKSGIANNFGLLVGACIIDEDYQGEIHLNVINTSREIICLTPGLKLVQFVLIPVFYDNLDEVDEDKLYLKQTERGIGAFGSTGLK